jgi:hypothetical protein
MISQNAFDAPVVRAEPETVPMPMAAEVAHVILRRVGKRPLTFRGVELCMAMSFTPGTPFWYEINIWRTEEQGFVLAIKTFYQSEDERDQSRAWATDSFDQVMDLLEDFDPARHMRPGLAADEPGLAPAEMVARALMQRARIEDARMQYGALVGEILHDLETG